MDIDMLPGIVCPNIYVWLSYIKLYTLTFCLALKLTQSIR